MINVLHVTSKSLHDASMQLIHRSMLLITNNISETECRNILKSFVISYWTYILVNTT